MTSVTNANFRRTIRLVIRTHARKYVRVITFASDTNQRVLILRFHGVTYSRSIVNKGPSFAKYARLNIIMPIYIYHIIIIGICFVIKRYSYIAEILMKNEYYAKS